MEVLAGLRLCSLLSGNKKHLSLFLVITHAEVPYCLCRIAAARYELWMKWTIPARCTEGICKVQSNHLCCMSLAVSHLKSSAQPLPATSHRARDSLLPRASGFEMMTFINSKSNIPVCFVGSSCGGAKGAVWISLLSALHTEHLQWRRH